MGKALLIIVLGAGFLVARQGYNNQLTEQESRKDQVEYEEEVLAREIARSGFNVAMGIAREYPNSLDAGANAVDMADSTVDGRYTGTARGGVFAVRAEALTGHTLKVTSTGYYGGTWDGTKYVGGESYTMWDTYKIKVLEVRQDGILDASFLESMAGYCSAVFMDEYYGDELVDTRMIFAPGKNRDSARPPVTFYVRAGTQLNFFIGVDTNFSCSSMHTGAGEACLAKDYVINYEFDHGNVGAGRRYDHIHYALDIPAEDISKMSESVWGMVEQHPGDRQRWRIGWEDQNRTAWDNPNSNDPSKSFWALKRLGYDGNGWPTRDAMGYRALRDYGNRPDYSDQVIELGIRALRSPAARDSLWYAMRAERDACGITSAAGMPPEPTKAVCHNGSEMTVKASNYLAHIGHGDTPGACIDLDEEGESEPDDDGSESGEGSESGSETGAGSESESGTDDSGAEQEQEEVFECPCSPKKLQKGKVGILHRPPGNPGNAKFKCISRNGWINGHKPNHDDVLICGNG